MQRRDDPPTLLPLYDAIAARPDDDMPRQILADALLELGDPRGEFIALQLLSARGVATRQQLAQEKTLRETHARRWLSEIPGIALPNVDLHRGFLRSCLLHPTGQGADSFLWRMVERVTVVPGRPPRELRSPGLARLQEIVGLDMEALDELLAGVEHPALQKLHLGAGPSTQAGATVQQATVLSLSLSLPWLG